MATERPRIFREPETYGARLAQWNTNTYEPKRRNYNNRSTGCAKLSKIGQATATKPEENPSFRAIDANSSQVVAIFGIAR